MTDKRKNTPLTDQEMYKLNNIDGLVKKERRNDELDRLNEVRQQKKVWRNVMLACGFLNLTLIIFAIAGYLQNV